MRLATLADRILAPYPTVPTSRSPSPTKRSRPGQVNDYAMIFHELATNSAKYGALSGGGSLSPRGDVADGHLRLTWDESSARAAAPKAERHRLRLAPGCGRPSSAPGEAGIRADHRRGRPALRDDGAGRVGGGMHAREPRAQTSNGGVRETRASPAPPRPSSRPRADAAAATPPRTTHQAMCAAPPWWRAASALRHDPERAQSGVNDRGRDTRGLGGTDTAWPPARHGRGNEPPGQNSRPGSRQDPQQVPRRRKRDAASLHRLPARRLAVSAPLATGAQAQTLRFGLMEDPDALDPTLARTSPAAWCSRRSATSSSTSGPT